MFDYVPYVNELRDIFQVKLEYQNLAHDELAAVVQDYSSKSHTTSTEDITIVGVHARRTDYAHHLSFLYNLTLVDDQYFLQAMSFYKEKFQVCCN